MSVSQLRPSAVVNIRQLKAFATLRLPKDSVLREALLREPDVLTAEDFVGRIGAWLRVLEVEARERSQ